MIKSNKNLSNALTNQRQRFSIRKLSVGATSVLLGTTLFLANGGVQARADNVNENSSQQVVGTEKANVVRDAKETTNNTEIQSTSQNNQKQVTDNNTDLNSQNSNSESNTKEAQLSKIGAVTSDYDEVKEDNFSKQAVKTNDETTSLNTQTLLAKQATVDVTKTNESSPAKEQVTATINIYDDTVDSEASDPAFSITWTGDKGTTIKQAVQDRIANDMKGYTISPAVDNQSQAKDIVNNTGSALNPNGSWVTNGGQEEYNKWLADKKENHQLAGYEIAESQPGDDIDTVIENGGSYAIDLVHSRATLNKLFFQEYQRIVYFKYYYSKSDSSSDVADPITKAGTATSYNGDGEKISTYPNASLKLNGYAFTKDDLNSSTIDLDKVESSIKFNKANLATNLPGGTVWVTDIDKIPAGVNGVLSYALVGRMYDVVTGLPLPMGSVETNQNNSSIIQFPGVDAATAPEEWETFDPNVPETTKDGMYMVVGGNTYAITSTSKPGELLHDRKIVTSPAPEYLYYYHNQPVDITFEDITDNLELSKFNAADLTVRKNSEYIPQKRKVNANKNTNYTAYSYKANDNNYQLTAQVSADELSQKIGKKITLPTDKLNYQTVLQQYLDNGFVLVSEDADDLTYDADQVWDSSRNLQVKHIVIKLAHGATAEKQPITKSATRTIHYVTDNNQVLQDPKTQTVSFTSDDAYYIDRVTGKPITSIKTENGQTIADDLTQPVITYHADNGKDTFAKVIEPTITKADGDLKGTWKVFKSTKDTWDGIKYTGNDATIAPEETVPSTVENGSHKDIYLVYKQQVAYNVHYRDVTDQYNSGKTSGYATTDGTDLGHEIHDINGSVGDAPDKTNDLWDYTKDGYVLVENPSGDNLAKATLIKDMGDVDDLTGDQYVYLVRLATAMKNVGKCMIMFYFHTLWPKRALHFSYQRLRQYSDISI